MKSPLPIAALLSFQLAAMTLPLYGQTLASLVDRNRVLLVFAATDHDALLSRQLKLLDHHAADLRDRDLLIIPILEQAGPPVTANTLRSLRPPVISDEEQFTIRYRFHVQPAAFAVILLGKDGGEKLRWAAPIPVDVLNQTIDAMPMRQQEIKGRQPK